MEFEKSVLILTHSDYLVTDAGVEKVIQGQQKLFLENEINFIAVYPIRKDIQVFGMVQYDDVGFWIDCEWEKSGRD